MTVMYLLGLVVLGVFANLLAEIFLARLVLSGVVVRSQPRIYLRWVVVMLGIVLAGQLGLRPLHLGFLALFAVSAAVDFESTYLPPDWYLYGCTAANIGVAALEGGEVLRGVVVTQAICFALGIFLAYFGAWAGGDVKLLMQYGAAAGSLPAAGLALGIEQLLRVGFIIVTFAWRLAGRHGAAASWAHTKSASMGPHGGVAFIGLALAHIARQVMA